MLDLREQCQEFIKKTHMTTSEFCERLHVTREGFYNWIKWETDLRKNTREKIEAYLNSEEAQSLLTDGSKYYTTDECAQKSGLSRNEIRCLCGDGILESKKTSGRRFLISKESLDRYLQKEHPHQQKSVNEKNDQESVFGSVHFDLTANWRFVSGYRNFFALFASEKEKLEFDLRYAVSDTGLVYNVTSNKILETKQNKRMYYVVNMKRKGKWKTVYVHFLVASFFCDNRLRKLIVHHIDGDKKNNNASNLIWVTYLEHRKCHRLMKDTSPEGIQAYREYIERIRLENKCTVGDKPICIPHPDYASDDCNEYYMYVTQDAYDKHQRGASWDEVLVPYTTGNDKNAITRSPIIGEFVRKKRGGMLLNSQPIRPKLWYNGTAVVAVKKEGGMQ